ncbi:hypothetical protein BC833DRAFT_618715 [Globomyces pollinis-pini]|nr:hypothetical protein BC833DRAFT_618715 [Globomyces pollinis-pini]
MSNNKSELLNNGRIEKTLENIPRQSSSKCVKGEDLIQDFVSAGSISAFPQLNLNGNKWANEFQSNKLNSSSLHAIGLDNLYDLGEAGEQIYDQLGTRSEWDWEKAFGASLEQQIRNNKQVDPVQLKENAKRRLMNLLSQLKKQNQPDSNLI